MALFECAPVSSWAWAAPLRGFAALQRAGGLSESESDDDNEDGGGTSQRRLAALDCSQVAASDGHVGLVFRAGKSVLVLDPVAGTRELGPDDLRSLRSFVWRGERSAVRGVLAFHSRDSPVVHLSIRSRALLAVQASGSVLRWSWSADRGEWVLAGRSKLPCRGPVTAAACHWPSGSLVWSESSRVACCRLDGAGHEDELCQEAAQQLVVGRSGVFLCGQLLLRYWSARGGAVHAVGGGLSLATGPVTHPDDGRAVALDRDGRLVVLDEEEEAQEQEERREQEERGRDNPTSRTAVGRRSRWEDWVAPAVKLRPLCLLEGGSELAPEAVAIVPFQHFVAVLTRAGTASIHAAYGGARLQRLQLTPVSEARDEVVRASPLPVGCFACGGVMVAGRSWRAMRMGRPPVSGTAAGPAVDRRLSADWGDAGRPWLLRWSLEDAGRLDAHDAAAVVRGLETRALLVEAAARGRDGAAGAFLATLADPGPPLAPTKATPTSELRAALGPMLDQHEQVLRELFRGGSPAGTPEAPPHSSSSSLWSLSSPAGAEAVAAQPALLGGGGSKRAAAASAAAAASSGGLDLAAMQDPARLLAELEEVLGLGAFRTWAEEDGRAGASRAVPATVNPSHVLLAPEEGLFEVVARLYDELHPAVVAPFVFMVADLAPGPAGPVAPLQRLVVPQSAAVPPSPAGAVPGRLNLSVVERALDALAPLEPCEGTDSDADAARVRSRCELMVATGRLGETIALLLEKAAWDERRGAVARAPDPPDPASPLAWFGSRYERWAVNIAHDYLTSEGPENADMARAEVFHRLVAHWAGKGPRMRDQPAQPGELWRTDLSPAVRALMPASYSVFNLLEVLREPAAHGSLPPAVVSGGSVPFGQIKAMLARFAADMERSLP